MANFLETAAPGYEFIAVETIAKIFDIRKDRDVVTYSVETKRGHKYVMEPIVLTQFERLIGDL